MKTINKNSILPRRILFLILLLTSICYIMPSAYAAAPVLQTGNSLVSGIEVVFPKQIYSHKQNENYTFYTHLFNYSNGMPLYQKPTCTIHLYRATGIHTLEQVMQKDSNGIDYELFVAPSNFTTLGTHAYIIFCNLTRAGVGGFVSGSIEVSKYGRDESEFQVSNLMMIIVAIGLAMIFIMISNSLAPEHVYFKLILLFFSFGMMYIMSDVVNKIFVGQTLEGTSIYLFYTITWLYRIFVGYIFIYTMYASAKWLGWFDGLKGWFKK